MTSIYYKNSSSKSFEEIQEFKKNSWVHLTNPSANELAYLAESLKLDLTLLTDALDQYEVPRIEIEDHDVYIYTRFAVEKEPGLFQSVPFLLINKKGYLVTLSPQPLPFMGNILSSKRQTTVQQIRLMIYIFSQVNLTYSQRLISISKSLRTVLTDTIKITNKDIIQFINLENMLYDFISSLTRIEAGYTNFTKQTGIRFKEPEADAIDDLRLEAGQLMQICKDNIRTVVNFREAYNTILTNNLNRVIKFFTALTVIITIPNIIGSFFGMNVLLPFAQHPLAFGFIILFALITSGALAFLFIKKDWM
ncbi:MAG: Mg2 transporter protein CorA family protein [Candidatus Collierbacteria bacterium GW2011_GWF2_44_15]|uniref:Mg2 transporter protein CorA family protein n=3 Tax=Candidatus Collieribacteriota TaxID=1752725 RepID=A0A0G1HIB9_9BACT|nr:MAG: Mg2 transporter protein CorA family protein [Candidatus Collierbacteria bacterium GW2011_GWF1_44_12]KKT46991.1 MAG: Mg2 transporter protein CorA family protein [Candidatus Collierbacteria bacterium GW2011_GWF2_44_15]KKU29244.1 MAG: Mg2 transporter protein CorA family protein [Candidatus Collierbacteria bacterium GW2011_GWE1_46_18]